MTEVGLVAAFAAGVLALLSPCSALLLPSFFAYAFASRRALVGRTMLFYVGLLLTLVPLGSGASVVSGLFYGQRALLISLAGWMIIALGVWQVLGKSFAMPFASRLQSAVAGRRSEGWVSTVALGAVYGLAGFCSGPVLGAILTVAATQDAVWKGGALLAVYALGMTLPLLGLAAVWDRYDLGSRSWLKGRTVAWGRLRVHTTSLVAGLLFIGVGTLFLRYDGTAGITGVLGGSALTALEFAAQDAVARWAPLVPTEAVLFLVAAIALGVAWRRRNPGEPVPRPAEDAHAQEESTKRHDTTSSTKVGPGERPGRTREERP